MKLYWRPGKISNASLAVLALVAVVVMLLVETNMVIIKQKHYEEKVKAVKLTAQAFAAVKKEALKLRKTLDPFLDPAGSGMVGLNMSDITSVVGVLEAKQTTVNPNFAAVIVQMMKRLKLKEGDLVAVGSSGSFPALNLATLASCKVLKLKCVMISSVAASMFGANDPGLTWLDMEQLAYVEGLIDNRSVAASIGGIDDNGGQLNQRGVAAILESITRTEVPLIRTGTIQGNIQERLRIYEQIAHGEPYKAYINVGGNEASVGSHFTKAMFKPGINRHLPRRPIEDEGVMTLMMRQYDLPLIHLSNTNRIAEQYGLPRAPHRMPALAEGPLFYNTEYNLWLTAILFALLLGVTVFIVHFDVGKLFAGVPREKVLKE